MKFKAGDRVHVTKLDNMKVDFYATLNSANLVSFKLEDCSNSSHEEKSVWKVVTNNSCDYYVLAEDEEDTKGGNNMPTIKIKKELNLPQLIEWAWENNVKDKTFCSVKDDRGVFYEVGFYDDGSFYSEDFLVSELVFTVEVEERIDEETVIPNLIVEYSYCSDVDLYKCFKVGDFMNDNAKSIYILNDDLTTTLIWTKEKGLV